MADPAFEAAVDTIAFILFPRGIDTSPNAPDTFPDLAKHWHDTGRMCVTDAWVPEDHPAFSNAKTYANFRAWHDWIHLMWNAQFTLAGECKTTEVHRQWFASLFGQENADKWVEACNAELVINNFGDCATCEV